jgi:hypothetical protein
MTQDVFRPSASVKLAIASATSGSPEPDPVIVAADDRISHELERRGRMGHAAATGTPA